MGTLKNLGNAAKELGGAFVDVVKQGEKVAEVIVKVQMAPTTVPLALAKGKPASEIIKEIQTQVADGAAAAAYVVTYPDVYYVNLARDQGGDIAGMLAQVHTGTTTYAVNLGAVAIESLTKDGRLPTPEEIASSPLWLALATAIKSARDQLYPNSKEVPKMVRRALKGHFSDEILAKARYTVGKTGIDLPEAINGAQSFMGQHEHAVTVDDLIVFSLEPDQDDESLLWWAHELQHVVQYDRVGISDFAVAYLKDYAAIEKEADDVAVAAMKD